MVVDRLSKRTHLVATKREVWRLRGEVNLIRLQDLAKELVCNQDPRLTATFFVEGKSPFQADLGYNPRGTLYGFMPMSKLQKDKHLEAGK